MHPRALAVQKLEVVSKIYCKKNNIGGENGFVFVSAKLTMQYTIQKAKM